MRLHKNEIVHLHAYDGEPVLFTMAAEISARLEDAAEKGVDESDVYGLMLEQGINVEMVRKYMGDAAANHMQEYCEEHGVV